MERKTPTPQALGAARIASRLRGALRNADGAAMVEAALVLPFMIMMLCGIMSLGTWFMTAHAVQQAADEGTRAALAGLTSTERTSLARAAVASSIAAASGVDRRRVSAAVIEDGRYVTVTVTFTPSNPNWLTYGMLPLRVENVSRTATIRVASL